MRVKGYFIMMPHLVLLFNIVLTGCLDVRGYRKTQRFLGQDRTLDWTLDTQTVTKTPQYDYRDEQKHRAHFWIHWIVNIYRAV